MTQEQILEMVKEAGFDVAQWAINGGIEVVIYEEGPITYNEGTKYAATFNAQGEK